MRHACQCGIMEQLDVSIGMVACVLHCAKASVDHWALVPEMGGQGHALYRCRTHGRACSLFTGLQAVVSMCNARPGGGRHTWPLWGLGDVLVENFAGSMALP